MRRTYPFGGRSSQYKAAQHRLRDARELQKRKRWRGAMYLAGYAIECRLKAKLMEMYDCLTLSELEGELKRRFDDDRIDLRVHRIEYLFQFTQARARLKGKAFRDFQKCNQWTTSWRYDASQGSQDECIAFLTAIEGFAEYLERNI